MTDSAPVHPRAAGRPGAPANPAPAGSAGGESRAPAATDPMQQATFIRRLKTFQERLLNVDLRNPSLFLRRIVRRRSFDLGLLPPEVRDEIEVKAAQRSGEVLLVADADAGDAAEALRTHLTTLSRQSAALTEETGLQELFVGLCWLEGHVTKEIFLRGPLVLVPAALEHRHGGRQPGWRLQFDDRRELQTNAALFATLRKYARFEEPLDLIERLDQAVELAGGSKAPPATLFHAAAELLRVAGLPIEAAHYVPELRVESRTSAAMAEAGRQPLQLASYRVAGLFPQASTALYLDYEAMIARAGNGETQQGIVDNLLDAPAPEDRAATPPPAPNLDQISESQLNLVLPSDPSQDAIIVKAKSAECVVVRGPPGTGKSQVIVNLVADALSRGERVLVVCQKRAALDVVYERLSRVGLGAAAFLVHDSSADRAATYRKVSAVLAPNQATVGASATDAAASTQPATAPGTPAHSAAGAEHAALSATIDDRLAKLRAIVDPLRQEFHGVRLSQLYARAQHGFKPRLDLPPGAVALSDRDLAAFLTTADAAQPGTLQFDRQSQPLSRRKNWAGIGHVERARLADQCAALGDRAKVAAPCVWRADAAKRTELAACAKRYVALQPKWYRILLPAWYGLKSAMAGEQAAMRGLPPSEWPDALDRAAHLEAALADLGRVMESAWLDQCRGWIDEPHKLEDLALAMRQLIEREFESIQRHDQIRKGLSADQLAVLSDCAERLDAAAWSRTLLHEFNLRWIDEAEAAHPALRGEPFARYEALRQEVATGLDRKSVAVAEWLSRTLAERQTTPSFPPDFQARGNRKAQTDWNKLAHEVGKKRYIKPLRTLLQEFAWPLSQVAPCWLLSPEACSEIFPLERGLFDLVIFDEASQLDVERALPVLYRARHVVVAGDENQMPPSHFFEATAEDAEDDEAAALAEAAGDIDGRAVLQVESLLLLAKRIYGFSYLGWHYRSEFQELIDFSNHAFYEGQLNVAANLGQPPLPPITWHAVAGTWVNRQNAVEARATVDLLAHALGSSRAGPFQSVGIITFNESQQEAIKDEIQRRVLADEQFAADWQHALHPASNKVDDRPFVKNIENVQGDERDIILFSVAYGPDPQGVFRRQFGPLSVEGGENRLNVAVTRARRAMRVVCSFDPETLDVSDAKNLGPRRFQQFLRYAKAVAAVDQARGRALLQDVLGGPAAAGASRGGGLAASPFEQALLTALQQAGLTVHPQWGAGTYRVDFAVSDPNDPARFCLGIEVDGPMYHSSRWVRERDLARRKFLEQRGWKLTRVWSRDWWLNPQRELQRILALVPKSAGATGV